MSKTSPSTAQVCGCALTHPTLQWVGAMCLPCCAGVAGRGGWPGVAGACSLHCWAGGWLACWDCCCCCCCCCCCLASVALKAFSAASCLACCSSAILRAFSSYRSFSSFSRLRHWNHGDHQHNIRPYKHTYTEYTVKPELAVTFIK